jgi:hypothetical protein
LQGYDHSHAFFDPTPYPLSVFGPELQRPYLITNYVRSYDAQALRFGSHQDHGLIFLEDPFPNDGFPLLEGRKRTTINEYRATGIKVSR